MKWDEFAFLNQQLAAMLRDGIPLEGALKQLCQTMQRGELRTEFELLEADLAKGVPLSEALSARQLPPLYKQMIQVGVKSGDLPGVLTMLADYYQRSNLIWTRLKGLMVYPVIVLVVSTLLSFFLAVIFRGITRSFVMTDADQFLAPSANVLAATKVGIWFPFVMLGLICAGVIFASLQPRVRGWIRWRFPGSREASLWRMGAAMEIMLEHGCTLPETIELMMQLEQDSPVVRDLAEWQGRLANGHAGFAEVAMPSQVIPPLFIWLVAGAGSDLVAGLKRAAAIYRARADYQTEFLLQAALPSSVIVLGAFILFQAWMFAITYLQPIIITINQLGSSN